MTKTNVAESRKDRLIHERNHDPYKMKRKPAEPQVCPECQAVFQGGRWQWLEAWPVNAHQELCQACRRIRDDYPAGMVTISGDFVATHKAEVLNVIRNQESAERTLHPLHRIIKIEEHRDTVTVSTTDLHLPKRIGEALRHAYKGSLDLHYDKEACFVRATWNSAT